MKKEYTQTSSSLSSSVHSQGKKTVLSDRFLIGEELGRGAYGQVYKGMDTTTGDVVAIKQIGLSGVSQENLAGVMGEIDLLKTLNHKNIVKYIGSFKTRSHLYIILEFMENGALSSVIKPNRFGVFPEPLSAIYIAQVLHGLAYLHDQGVVHRDIKGANILTTKDGLVKLADFGVAAKLGELEEQHNDELHQNVVGTPYWMAPEVIEMTQVTPASDIWSVGCLIIELLTGYPPYYDLQPMSALFRIVQDAHPPLPESISPLLEDFLLKCFQKDPSARPDARSLLQHEWVQYNRKTLRGTWSRSGGFKSRGAGKSTDAHETVNSVVARILQAEYSEDELSLRSSADAAAVGAGQSAAAGGVSAQRAAAAVRTIDAAAGPLASNTPARLALQQDALLTASSIGGQTAGVGNVSLLNAASAPPQAGPTTGGADGLPPVYPHQRRIGSIELATAVNGTASPLGSPRSRLSHAQLQFQQQQQQPQQAGQQQLMYRQEQQQLYTQQQQIQQQQIQQQQVQQQQIQQQQVQQSQQQRGQQVAQQQQQAQVQQQQEPQQQYSGDRVGSSTVNRPPPLIFVGQQLQYGPAAGQPGPLTPHSAAAAGASSRYSPARSAFPLSEDLESPLSNLLARMQTDQAAAVSPQQAGAGGALLAWIQEDMASPGGPKGQVLGDGLFGGSFLMPTPSNASLDSLSLSQVELDGVSDSSFLLETKRKVRQLVRSLRPGAREANMTAQQAALSLAAMFNRVPESKQHFLQEAGMLAALELLETDQVRLAEAALDLLTAFAAGQARLLESLCLTGFIPIIARMAAGNAAVQSGAAGLFTAGGPAPAAAVSAGNGPVGSAPSSRDAASPAAGATGVPGAYAAAAGGVAIEAMRLRCKAAGFVAQLCLAKDTTLQMFIACGGVRSLVAMVQDNLLEPTTLTPVAVGCIWKVLDTYGALPVNYICRMLAHAGLVQRLYAVVKQLVNIDRQQQQRVIGSGGAPRGTMAGGMKLHHLHSPSSPSVFGQVIVPGLSTDLPGASPDSALAATVDQTTAATAAATPTESGRKGNLPKEALAGMDELQHRRAFSVGDSAASAALSPAAQDRNPTQGERLMETSLDLLLVMAYGDSVVKSVMCSRDNLQHLLDLLQRLQQPGQLLKVMRTLTHLTRDPSVLGAVKDSGAISQLVPFLSRQSEAVMGQTVVMEALEALYNICKFNKKVHLEVAATAGIIPHLSRFATEMVSMYQAPPAASSGNPNSSVMTPAVVDPLADPAALSAQTASDARRAAVRSFVLPMLIGMVHTSSSTRAKLWANNGLDLFLQLMATEDAAMQVGIMRTLDLWLAEDHTRVENRLCQREAVSQLVEVYNRLCRSAANARSPVMPQMLDSLKLMLGRSSKVAVALAAGGVVPALLEPLTAGLMGGPAAASSNAPILRAKLLEIVRILYQHYPRPKEFIMKYRIQDVLLRLLESEGRGEDAVKIEAQKLLNAFHINVLL